MRGGRVFLPFLLVAALLIPVTVPPAAGEDFYSQEKCSLCHIRKSIFFSPGFASPETLKAFEEERVCYSCHNGTVRDSRGVLWQGAQHPPVASGGGPGGKRCSVCHSPHSKGWWGVLAGTSIPIRKGGDAVCTKCHARYERAAGAIHRTGFPEGGCAECHRAHGGTGKALLLESRGTLCLKCHPDVASEKSGGHPVARSVAADRRPFPECVTCHPVHRKQAGDEAIEVQCAACHAFAKGARTSGAKVHPSVAKCTTCHSFHLKSAQKGRGLRRAEMRADLLCGSCHATQVADDLNRARQRGTHPTGSAAAGKDLCLRCHRIHGGAPETPLLASAKSYSCLECHEGQNTISEIAGIVLAHPVFERVEKGRLAAATRARHLTLGPSGEIVCRTCHVVHRASPNTALLAPGTEGDGSCVWCHETSRSWEHLPPGNAATGPQCGTCHPVHGKRWAAPGGSGVADAWAAVCTSCHARAASHAAGISADARGRQGNMPVFDARGRKLRTGAISCPTCHEPHGKAQNKRLRRAYAASGFLCTSCHREKETVALTPHDLRGIAGKSICEPCHQPHGGKSPWMWGLSMDEGALGSESCRSCHRHKGLGKPVPGGGHPLEVVSPNPVPDTFPLFGAAGGRARKGVLTCSTCHEVHGTGFVPLGQGTGILLRARPEPGPEDIGRVRTCVPCHQGKEAKHGQADCIWCHPPHEAQNSGPECQVCHTMGRTGIARAHAERRLECGACHRMHPAKEGSRPEGPCLACHPKTAGIVGTSHAETDGGPCRGCHPAHKDIEDKPARRHNWEELFAPDLACLRCHREDGPGPSVAQGDHPKSRRKVPTSYGAVVTLETPIVMLGRLQEGGKPVFPLFDESGRKSLSGRMGCLTCHDPHAGATLQSGAGGHGVAAYLRDPSVVFLSEICAPCHKNSAGEYARRFHELPRKTD